MIQKKDKKPKVLLSYEKIGNIYMMYIHVKGKEPRAIVSTINKNDFLKKSSTYVEQYLKKGREKEKFIKGLFKL